MGKKLNFYPISPTGCDYKELIEKEKKTTTVRFGDKYYHLYSVGDIVSITVGFDPEEAETIAEARIKEIYAKKLGYITEKDLEGESPDSLTPKLLRNTLNGIYKKRIGRPVRDDDWVTIIKWGYICPFCSLPEERFIYRDNLTSALFSLWPVSDYHTLLIPTRHVTHEKELTEQEVIGLHKLRIKLVNIIEEKIGLRHYNLGLNQGKLAGQTISHIHYHLIFRKEDDIEDPTGGIRNIIPGKGNYKKFMVEKREKDVEKWTNEIKKFVKKD
jgi:diadenosine tetraphosphate (Ap4A) HIT family hydrolase